MEMLRRTSGRLFRLSKNVLGGSTHQSCRSLMMQEATGMNILEANEVPVPAYGIARSAHDARKVAARIGGQDFVVKAQVLAGGRGKGRFDSGLMGGVQIVYNPEEAGEKSDMMIGHNLVTKQTDAQGCLVEEVVVCKRLYTRREYYFAITTDRHYASAVMLGSSHGGVNIEEVAQSDRAAIVTMPVSVDEGLTRDDAIMMAQRMRVVPATIDQAVEIILKLYNLFWEADCTLLEINPLAEDVTGSLYCMDCKMVIDDNAEYRQDKYFKLRDRGQENPQEIRAAQTGLNYIHLSGNIGCMVNGAGLAMATMDIINLHGGKPANFLDVGGGASVDQVMEAFRIITSDQTVSSILVNIFGGIMRCDIIAQGIINAAEELHLKVPIVCRLQGAYVDDAKALIANSPLRILACDNLDEAARLVVKLASIVSMAREVEVDVKFELPI